MTWEEMLEEGLENFNFFNFSSFRFSGIVNGLRKYYVGIIPRCKLLDHDLDYGYKSQIYFQEFTGMRFYGQGLEWINGNLEKILKRATEKDPDSPQLLFSAELLSYLIESRRSLNNYCSFLDKPNYFDEEEMREIIQIINNHPLITLIETDEEHIYKCKFEYYCNHHYINLLFNQYAIELGLNRKLSDLQNMFGAWIDENIVLSRRKYYGEYHPPYEEDSLYWINKLGQPIFLTNESRFNQDYCSTKVDLEEGLVEFFFKNPIPLYKRGDNSLVYEEYSNYKYSSFEKIIIDFVNDKIIGNERRIDY
jgi:hypothetical protein